MSLNIERLANLSFTRSGSTLRISVGAPTARGLIYIVSQITSSGGVSTIAQGKLSKGLYASTINVTPPLDILLSLQMVTEDSAGNITTHVPGIFLFIKSLVMGTLIYISGYYNTAYTLNDSFSKGLNDGETYNLTQWSFTSSAKLYSVSADGVSITPNQNEVIGSTSGYSILTLTGQPSTIQYSTSNAQLLVDNSTTLPASFQAGTSHTITAQGTPPPEITIDYTNTQEPTITQT